MQIRIYEMDTSLKIKLVHKRGVEVLANPNPIYGVSKKDVIDCLKILYNYKVTGTLSHGQSQQ